MSDTRLYSWRHHDAQDDEATISLYADVGIGPAVVFDGGGFTDHVALRAFAFDLLTAAFWLTKETAAQGGESA